MVLQDFSSFNIENATLWSGRRRLMIGELGCGRLETKNTNDEILDTSTKLTRGRDANI